MGQGLIFEGDQCLWKIITMHYRGLCKDNPRARLNKDQEFVPLGPMAIYQTRCDSYDPDVLDPIIDEHISNHFKGMDLNGKKVLLKVNLLSGREPEKAVTTHPEFLASVARAFIERGAYCTIADSPGGHFTQESLTEAYARTGYVKVAQSTGSTLNFDTSSHTIAHHKGRIVKSFKICDYVCGHDIIIALPKLKTHTLMGLTCATKIMFGVVPGMDKVLYHTRFPNPDLFARMLLDLTDAVRPDLFIVDGIVGMEGQGPAHGQPRDVGIILSGKDDIEIDTQICRIVGIEPTTIPHLRICQGQGKDSRSTFILVEGRDKDFVLDSPFKPASGWALAKDPPKSIVNIIKPLTTSRPVIDDGRCVGCGVCRDNCAANCITLKANKARIANSDCIRCYCCAELCPNDAIALKEPPSSVRFIIEKIYGLFESER